MRLLHGGCKPSVGYVLAAPADTVDAASCLMVRNNCVCLYASFMTDAHVPVKKMCTQQANPSISAQEPQHNDEYTNSL